MNEISAQVNSSMTYLLHCNNFCKSHNVPSSNTTTKIFFPKKVFIMKTFLDALNTWRLKTQLEKNGRERDKDRG
jgi:hypothetical protein